jgi:hypothetical protein
MKWFKHDSDASQDNKLQNVLLDYGLEGYGLYWYCLELIVGKIDVDNIMKTVQEDAENQGYLKALRFLLENSDHCLEVLHFRKSNPQVI